jgi:hypothetical protein
MFTYELSRRLEGQKITGERPAPRFVDTNFGEHGGAGREADECSPKDGAIPPEEVRPKLPFIWPSSPEVEGISGKNFSKRKRYPHPPLTGQSAWEALWSAALK